MVFDPATYTGGVPFEVLSRLRRDTPVAWVPEIPVLGWPEGPGFWLVLRHADVESVLRRPELFSSALGATQIRDPATPRALSYVRRMMLNMDPPEHSRLRRLLSRSFTPRAVAQLEDGIRRHARAICDRVFVGPRGECDFAKDVAADLPLLTLADVLGVPEQDRWLLFDWSNRVIGYQDPDYASSAEFDPARGTPMAREALSVRPVPDADGRMPTRAPGRACRIFTPTLTCWPSRSGAARGRRDVDPAGPGGRGRRTGVGGRVREHVLAVRRGWATRRCATACLARASRCSSIPQAQDELRADPRLLPVGADEMLRWWTPVMTFRRTATVGCELGGQPIRAGDKVVVSFTSANRDDAVFADPGRFDIRRHPNPHLVFGHGPHFCLGAHLARTQMRALFAEVLARTSALAYGGAPSYLRSNFQRGVKRLPVAWTA